MKEKHNIDFVALSKIKTWREFDELFTSQVYPSYLSVADYYYTASCLS